MTTTTITSFKDLGVPDPLTDALDRMRIHEPFEIQELTLPEAVAGRDVLGRAPTGSGKTLAFGLAVLSRLHTAGKSGSKNDNKSGGKNGSRGRGPASLILSPTRELAEQICRELEPLAREIDRNVLAVYGGKGLERQIQGLRRGVDVLVACPGRLLDLMDQGYADLSQVEVAVVDEADRMADMGFLPDVRRILDKTPDDRQTLLFSATLDNDVRVLTDRYQRDPVERAVADLEPDLTTMSHRFIKTDKRERAWLAADLITDLGPTVVFVRTRHGVDRLARQLQRAGVRAVNLHGGRSQSQRDRALASFSNGKSQALVATDVAARGIHVDGVACVIHYDPPAEIKDYVHRSGRTARAGANGVVVSFLASDQVKSSLSMQKTLGVDGLMEETPERRHHLAPVVDEAKSRSGKSKGKSASGRKSSGGRKSSNGSRTSSGSSQQPSGESRRSRAKAKSADARTKSGSKSGRKTGPKSDSKPNSTSRSSARSTPKQKSESTSGATSKQGTESKSGTTSKRKPKSKSQSKKRGGGPQAKSTGGSGGRDKSRSKAAKGKRSGKPRPKNRKNKPKSARAKTTA